MLASTDTLSCFVATASGGCIRNPAFHILSDIHLEWNKFTLEKAPDVDNLILAGDIGIPTSQEYKVFIERASELYTHVFLINGNHEYYRNTIEWTNDKVKQIANKYANVHFLNNDCVDIGEYRILGTTLWSEIADDQRGDIGIFLADFRLIKDWSIEKHNHEHFKSVRFIKQEIERASIDSKNLIIISHHAPLTHGTSDKHNSLSSAFCTDLSDLFIKPVKAWICGHTHYSCDFTFNGVHVISNQLGYNGEATKFDPLCVLDI